jgi:hypothetical protein
MATESIKNSGLEVRSHSDEVYEMQPTSKLGGTNHDDHDMRMLGRTQQLNVCEGTPSDIASCGSG